MSNLKLNAIVNYFEEYGWEYTNLQDREDLETLSTFDIELLYTETVGTQADPAAYNY